MNPKKKVIMRALMGAPVGFMISTAITVVFSLIYGDGSYYPVMPELIEDCGNEINAVVIQAVSAMICGAAWGGASVIWEMEDWSLLKQTMLHFLIGSFATLPVAWLMRWMERSAAGALEYCGIFFGIYLAIWLALYFSIKRKIQCINRQILENSVTKNQ